MKSVKIFVEDIVSFLGNQVIAVKGDVNGVFIDNLADVAHVNETTLDWIQSTKTNKQEIAEKSVARVILVDAEVRYTGVLQKRGKILIYVERPKLVLAQVGNEFFLKKRLPSIHSSSVLSPGVKIGKDVYIGPNCYIEACEIGDDCIIESNVHIYDNVKIGNNCRIKSGAVIGGEGFGFEKDENGNRFRFPQIGSVIIGNYVEIGANTCIDRGALSDTIINDYVKIDNLCHIAHNVNIGDNAMIIACSEISGSCYIGANSWIGPNTSIRDWREVGSGAVVGIGSNVVKNIPEQEVWAGNPAKKM